ncbi:MAG TPA: hypothetical protein VE987_01920, partial [Polyangiaceae bacterium]|nr:hypothetical protein [Polyangiaceae bacterium]
MASRKKTKGGGPFEALRAMKDEIAARAPAPPAPAAPAPRKPSPPSEDAPEDEALLFHRLFAGVEPLDRSRGRVSRQPAHETSRSPEAAGAAGRRREAAQAESEAVHERLRALVEPEGRFEVADDGSHVEGRRSDLPADALRRLRRGLLPIDARLDLHGMRLEEARAELAAFLRTMRARGER